MISIHFIFFNSKFITMRLTPKWNPGFYLRMYTAKIYMLNVNNVTRYGFSHIAFM